MNTVLGANWRTTLTGWITVLASAIAVNPSLISFLPESSRNTITGIAGLIAGAMAKRAEAEKAAIEDAFPMTGPIGIIASDK